ncbi:MAG: SLBB domain-containing protein [Pseudomonadota bacterium]
MTNYYFLSKSRLPGFNREHALRPGVDKERISAWRWSIVQKWLLTALMPYLLCSASAVAADTLKVHSLKSKLLVAEVAAATPYTIERTVGNWNIVRFTTPVVPAWLSESYVRESEGSITVTADRLNLRMGPSTQDRVLTGVARGFNSPVLARSEGFVQVYAPTWVLFSLRANGEGSSSLARSPGTDQSATPATAKPSWKTRTKTGLSELVETSTETPPKDEKEDKIVAADSGFATVEEVNTPVGEYSVAANEPPADVDTKAESVSVAEATGDQPDEQRPAEPQVASANAQDQSPTRFTNIPPVVNEAQAIARSHRLSPGDSISLKVFGEPDLSLSTVRIPQSGRVSFPLIGSVEVAQKTTKDVEGILRQALSQGYINDPQLLVSIDSYRPIFVRGAVQQTGAFPYTEGLTVAKVIALAGGAKNSARQDGVSISRDGTELQSGLSVNSQYQISSGDILSIEEEIGVSEESGFYVYLHGEVSRPGEYEFRRGLTVEKAVVLAGGFTLRASRKRISVSRIMEGEEAPQKFKKVDLYMPVQPGDIIDVGASWF